MSQLAPPPLPPVALDEDDGLGRLRFRLGQVLISTLTILATAWFCTFGWIPAIIALLVAKHVLVAIFVMGIGVDGDRRNSS
jgi:hypothetical protein